MAVKRAIKENWIENKLCERVRAIGGIAEKVTVIGARGFFDRLLVFPGGQIILCEVKKPKGGNLSPHQMQRLMLYQSLGVAVEIIWNEEDIERLIQRAERAIKAKTSGEGQRLSKCQRHTLAGILS